MTPAARDSTIQHFSESCVKSLFEVWKCSDTSSSSHLIVKNADVTVFMVSLKAGGVALNLTEASRVFLMDPWWN